MGRRIRKRIVKMTNHTNRSAKITEACKPSEQTGTSGQRRAQRRARRLADAAKERLLFAVEASDDDEE